MQVNQQHTYVTTSLYYTAAQPTYKHPNFTTTRSTPSDPPAFPIGEFAGSKDYRERCRRGGRKGRRWCCCYLLQNRLHFYAGSIIKTCSWSQPANSARGVLSTAHNTALSTAPSHTHSTALSHTQIHMYTIVECTSPCVFHQVISCFVYN